MKQAVSNNEGLPLNRRKRWGFRIASIVLGLCAMLGFELLCRLAGWGEPSINHDPFVGFDRVTPLFEQREDEYRVAPARLKFFAKESFAADKPEDEFRIFILGGSTVQGRPYSVETTFGTWLELGLQAENPDRSWEVVNCGGLSYASYRLVPILEECLTYQPDLIVLCTGHNEFLEDRSYDHLKPDSALDRFSLKLVSHSRTFRLMQSAIHSDSEVEKKPKLKDEVDAILDYNDSLKAYHRDDDWRDQIVEHFEFNLRRMIALCRQADIPLILIRPPANLADSPPFKSEHSETLSGEQLKRVKELMTTARSHYRDDLSLAIDALEKAVKIDPRFALAWYELGQCYLTCRQTELAKRAFLKARDEDVCPLRIISPLEHKLMEIAESESTPFLDAYRLLEQQSRDELLDDQWLADHVHPTVTGHQQIAAALQQTIQELGLCRYKADSESRSNAWHAHLRSLDDIYFLTGRETLKSLRGWAEGRADGPPAKARYPERFQRVKTEK